MPPANHRPGDQHEIIANPFEEPKTRVSEYTAQEIATLQSRLEKQLGPEYLSERAGPGGAKVHYITAEKCIALANEIFGFNGWSSSIKVVTMDFCDEHPQTAKVSLGLSVIVRVTLRDGTFHEDIGYGHIENCAGKAKAFEKAKKEGTTDALKRALRNFGNVLGNCIYDKDYVKKVTKMKVQPNRMLDEGGLHRHSDYIKREVKTEPALLALPAPPAVPAAVHNGGSTGTSRSDRFTVPVRCSILTLHKQRCLLWILLKKTYLAALISTRRTSPWWMNNITQTRSLCPRAGSRHLRTTRQNPSHDRCSHQAGHLDDPIQRENSRLAHRRRQETNNIPDPVHRITKIRLLHVHHI